MCGARGHRNGETRTSLSTTTMPRLTGPLKFRSFCPRTTWQWSPIPHTHPIWPPVTFSLPQAEASDEGSNIRHHWRDSRGIAAGTWHNSKKGLPGMLPSMAETLRPLYSCKRGVLWKWWRNLTSKVSKLLFTSTVLELLDTPLYIPNCSIKMHYGRFIASILALTSNACAVYPSCTFANSLYFGQVFGYWPIQRSRALMRGFAAARMPGLRVRIPPGALMSVSCDCCVVSGRSLCDGPIPSPEESYRLWCFVVCDLETSKIRRQWPTRGCPTIKKIR